MNKVCTKCKEEKPLEAFHRAAAVKTGRRPWCKACVSAYMRERAERLRLSRRSPPVQEARLDPEEAPVVTARELCGFAAEIHPGRWVTFLDVPYPLKREEADKLKGLIQAYADLHEYAASGSLEPVRVCVAGGQPDPVEERAPAPHRGS